MRHATLFASALLALTAPVAAQLPWAGDNFDSYADGQALDNVGGWFGWDNTPAAAGHATTVRKLSAPNGMLCDGNTDAVHPDIGINCGKWVVTAWQRITLGDLASGDVFFIINNVYNHGGPYTWTVEVSASNSTSTVQDDFVNGTTRVGAPLPVVYNRWVEIRCEIDLDADTIDTYYDGQLLSSGLYTISGGPAVVSNMDLFSAGGTCYWDDISLRHDAAPNEFGVFNGSANAASRGNFGPGEGSLFQDYPPSHFRGIGDNGTDCTISGFQYVVQDQNTITQDPYTWAVRTGTATGPTLGAGGLLAAYSLSTPLGGGGGGAWAITLSLSTELSIPCNDHVFVGYQFPAFAGWPSTDGPSSQARFYSGDSTFLTGQPHHSWQFIGDPDTGAVSQTSARCMSVSLRTAAPTLRVGSLGANVSPDFGATGMYTSVGPAGSGLGLTFGIHDAVNPNGNAIVLLGSAYDPSFALGPFGIEGNLWLTTGLIGQIYATTLDGNGDAIGAPAWMGVDQLHRFTGSNASVLFQAITWSQSGLCNVRATNGAGTRLF